MNNVKRVLILGVITFRFCSINPESGHYHYHSLCFFKYNFWAFHYCNRAGWFRLFGRGFKWKDISIHGLMFSERIGVSKPLRIGKWSIKYLPCSV